LALLDKARLRKSFRICPPLRNRQSNFNSRLRRESNRRTDKWKSNLATLELWSRELLPDCKDQTILAPLTASLIMALAQREPSRQSTTAETNNMAQSITAFRALAESLVALWEASDEKT
jgi:hypothetical protein